ncbi:MAG: tetratricopeptide repeat protein [Acidobacteriota bacterium]|nr:tetratricopeptide repeat protein [Acidobacteriota bacterium]
MATAYFKIGNVQGEPGQANLGDSQGALASHLKALALRQKLAAAGDPTDRRSLAQSYLAAGSMLSHTGHTREGLDDLRKAVEIGERINRKDAAPGERLQLAKSYEVLANLQDGMGGAGTVGDPQNALENHGRALAIYQALLALDPGNNAVRRLTGNSQLTLGDSLAKHGSTKQALEKYRQALDIFQGTQDHANARARRALANAFYRIGNAFLLNGDASGALDGFNKGLAISEELFAADPRNARARLDVAEGYADVGEAEAKSGNVAGGIGRIKKGIAIKHELAISDPRSATIQTTLLSSYLTLGEILDDHRDHAGALHNYAEAAQLAESQLAADPNNVDARLDLARSLGAKGDLNQALAVLQPLIPQRGMACELAASIQAKLGKAALPACSVTK